MAEGSSQPNPSHQPRDQSRSYTPPDPADYEKAWGEREELFKELGKIGIEPFYFPQGDTIKPANEKTLPILTTKLSDLASKDHVIIISMHEDNYCGILSRDVIKHKDYGLEKGTILGLAKKLQSLGSKAPGLIVTNPGELRWSSTKQRGLLTEEYKKENPKNDEDIDPHPHDVVEDHEAFEFHFNAVVHWVLESGPVQKNATFSLVVVGTDLVPVDGKLQRPNSEYRELFSRLSTLAWNGFPPATKVTSEVDRTLEEFMYKRTRAWAGPLDPITKQIRRLGRVGAFNIETVAAANEDVQKQFGFSIFALHALAMEPILYWLLKEEKGFVRRNVR